MGKKSSRYEPYAPCDMKCHVGKCLNPDHTIVFTVFRRFVREHMTTWDRRVQFNDMKKTKSFNDWLKWQYKRGFVCFYCNIDLVGEKYHIDHYMPLKHKGGNTTKNFRVSCPTCNLRKGSKIPWDMQ